MFKRLVFGIFLAHSAFSDDVGLRQKSTETENLLPHFLRSPYIVANRLEIQENSAHDNTTSPCPNTAILLQILEILSKPLSPFGNPQLEPEKIKYVLEVIKNYLEYSTPSKEYAELYSKFINLKNLYDIHKKTVSRTLHDQNDIQNDGLKMKATVQIELPVQTSNGQNLYEYIANLLNSAYFKLNKYCDSTGRCNNNKPKWNAKDNDYNFPYNNNPAAQKPNAYDLSKIILYLQPLPRSQHLDKEDNLPSDTYGDSNSNNVKFIGNNDIMSLLQNYRPQESASGNSNVQNNQVPETLLEQLFSNQSPGQIYVKHPGEQQNQAINILDYGKVANNDNPQNNQMEKSLLEKLYLLQTPYSNVQQNQDLIPLSGSSIHGDTSNNMQNNPIQKLLLEKRLWNLTPGQNSSSHPNEPQNQANPPQTANNAINQLQNNITLTLLLEKLLFNQTPSQLDDSYLNTQQSQPLNKPTDSSNIFPSNVWNVPNQDYQAPDTNLQSPTQLNVTYRLSNGRVLPVQSNQININSNTSVGNLPGNNNYALDKLLYSTMQLGKKNPLVYTPNNDYGQSPNLINNQQTGAGYLDTINLQGNSDSVKLPLNPVKNIQNYQYPSIGYPSDFHYNTKQDVSNPNQQNTFNQFQNTDSQIIGLNQVSQPGYIISNAPPYVNKPYVNPYVIGSSLTDNNVHGNNRLNLADSQRLVSGANVVKLNSASDNSNKLVEITYVLQRPQQVLYEPVYYIKYRIPYDKFKYNLDNLLLMKPYLQNNPNVLYQELLARTNLSDTSQDIQGVDRTKVIKLVGTNGTLINAKLVRANETAVGEQLKIVQELNSKLDPKNVLNLNIAAVNQLKQLHLPQLNNLEIANNTEKAFKEQIAKNTLAVEPTSNSQSLNQVNLSAYSSQLLNKNQPLINNPLVYSGQQTMQYQVPVLSQVPNLPLVYSKNPLMYKQSLVYGK